MDYISTNALKKFLEDIENSMGDEKSMLDWKYPDIDELRVVYSIWGHLKHAVNVSREGEELLDFLGERYLLHPLDVIEICRDEISKREEKEQCDHIQSLAKDIYHSSSLIFEYFKTIIPEGISDKVILMAVSYQPACFSLVPANVIENDRNLIENALVLNPEVWKFIPQQYKTNDLENEYYYGVLKKGHLFSEVVKENELTADKQNKLADFITERYPLDAGLLPKEFMTVYRVAPLLANETITSFDNFPEGKEAETILYAFRYTLSPEDILKKLPERLNTENFWIDVIQGFLENENIDSQGVSLEELMKDAILWDANALLFIPESFRTQSMYERVLESRQLSSFPENILSAFGNNPLLPDAFLRFSELLDPLMTSVLWYSIKKENYTDKLVDTGIKVHADFFADLPDNWKTHERSLKMCTFFPPYLTTVPEGIKDFSFCLEVYKQSPYALLFFPPQFLEEDFLLDVVKKNPEHLTFIDKEYRTVNICRQALDSGISHARNFINDLELLLDFLDTCKRDATRVPTAFSEEHFKHDRLVKECISRYPKDFGLMPDFVKRDSRFIQQAVTLYPENLKEIPFEKRTAAICLQAYLLDIDRKCAGYIPLEIKKGKNIFSMSQQLMACSGRNFSYQECQDIYEGKLLKVSCFTNQEGCNEKGVYVKWHKERQGFIKQEVNGILNKLFASKLKCIYPLKI